MKVKAIQDYNDTVLKKLITKDTELEVADARGKVLIDANVCVAIPTTTTKKGGRKKADE